MFLTYELNAKNRCGDAAANQEMAEWNECEEINVCLL
jgi:hypothetical protein